MDRTEHIVNCIKNNTPMVYCKFGDGEFLCMIRYTENGPLTKNCDNDNYTQKLSNSLIESFKYLTSKQNVFIGRWKGNNNSKISKYYNNLVNNEILWTDYHTLIFEPNEIDSIDPEYFIKKISIYKEIQQSTAKKIYICNKLLVKSKMLLSIDNFVHVPYNSWFDNEFDKVFKEVLDLIPADGKCIILTSCGMSAKVLITELFKIYPNIIYIDIGSGLDLICTKKNSREQYTYKNIYLKFKKFYGLPEEWFDSKYNYIYEEANRELGLHLPKTEIYDESNDLIIEPKYSSAFTINSNNCYHYYLDYLQTHNFITNFNDSYSIVFKSKKSGKIKLTYQTTDKNTCFDNDDIIVTKVDEFNGNLEFNINKDTNTILKFKSMPCKKLILKNIKFLYSTRNDNYENIVFISSKIYTSNNPFNYTPTRSIYSTEIRFSQTIKTIESVKQYIPNVYIILFDNSNFTPYEFNQLKNLVNVFINVTNEEIDYYTNISLNKAYSELCQTYYTIREISNLKFKNFFKITGRYLINETFDYKIFDNEFNIFKHNPIFDENFYYTSFYKISYSNFNNYSNVINELFESIKKNNKLYDGISYEIFFPIKLNIKKLDYLGITEYIAVRNEINYI